MTVWRGVTNESGVYRAPQLHAGTYNATVEMQSLLPSSVGNLGRNTVPPGELDLAVSREFPIGERLRLRIRADAFNILNHTNFQTPNVSLNATTNATGQPIFNSPGFGLITSARAARFMQLVARF